MINFVCKIITRLVFSEGDKFCRKRTNLKNCKEANGMNSLEKCLRTFNSNMAGKDQKLEKTVKFSKMQFAGDRSCIQEK